MAGPRQFRPENPNSASIWGFFASGEHPEPTGALCKPAQTWVITLAHWIDGRQMAMSRRILDADC